MTIGAHDNANWNGAYAQQATTASGLPVPRFVSVRSDPVNVRIGPSADHEIAWVYTRARLPLEIVQEFENWRRVRDWEGQEGWVFHSLLSGRRTALVTPWTKEGTTSVRTEPHPGAGLRAELAPMVLVDVDACENGWCAVSGNAFRGYLEQTRPFGVNPNEEFR